MRKRVLGAALGIGALLVAGGLFASNMGFKLNYPMTGPGGAGGTGNNSLALPYNQQTNILVALDLINDINATAGSSIVASVARYVRSNDAFDVYTGLSGSNFAITPAEAYLVKLTAAVNYIVVGSDNPGLVVTHRGPQVGVSATGNNYWAYPYHSTASNALGLISEINTAAGSSVVTQVSRYVKSNDSFDVYTGLSGNNFTLTPGEGYFVKVSATVSYVPSHY